MIKSLSSGARLFRSASGERLVVSLSVFITSRLCLSARFLRVTQRELTSIRCIGLLKTVTEDWSGVLSSPRNNSEEASGRLNSVAQSASAGTWQVAFDESARSS